MAIINRKSKSLKTKGRSLLQNQRIIDGSCWRCSRPRGQDGTTICCRKCANKAIETKKQAEAAYLAMGRCVSCHDKLSNGTTYRCTKCSHRNHERWKQINSQEHRIRFYRQVLLKKYNLTIDQYDALVKQQKGLCAICHNPPSPKRKLSVDHCHSTLKVRELLCTACNSGIGQFRDNPDLMNAAAQYVRKHQQEPTSQ